MMNTITKKILIDRIADSTGMKRVAVKQIVQEFLDQVIVELGEGNRLEFRDFGVFEGKQRAPRIAQNPKTLEPVPVPAKRTVKFKVGRRMREAMESPINQRLAAKESTIDTGATDPDALGTPTSPKLAASGSTHRSTLHVEMGPGVVATIRPESAPTHEHEPASVH